MKKLLLAATLLTALTTAAFADGKKSTTKLANQLKESLKSLNESAWVITSNYKKASFTFNGQSTHAFLSVETGDLIGFSFDIDKSALPEAAKENFAKKYQGWKIDNAIMFLDGLGNVNYFAQVSKDKKSLALMISPRGSLSIYARIPQ